MIYRSERCPVYATPPFFLSDLHDGYFQERRMPEVPDATTFLRMSNSDKLIYLR